MLPTDALLESIEFRFAIDRAFAAHEAGRRYVADAFARAAEAILKLALPDIADDVALTASRKGRGDAIGPRLAPHLTADTAAAVAVVWMLRGARQPAVRALSEAFRSEPEFDATIRLLCSRIVASPPPPAMSMVPIEVASPAWR